jgi:hypothetical protein
MVRLHMTFYDGSVGPCTVGGVLQEMTAYDAVDGIFSVTNPEIVSSDDSLQIAFGEPLPCASDYRVRASWMCSWRFLLNISKFDSWTYTKTTWPWFAFGCVDEHHTCPTHIPIACAWHMPAFAICSLCAF